jgi:ATP/maltotriose-dependent transcriptional regulator MalT
VLLANGDLDGADARLRNAERWLATAERAHEGHRAGSSAVVVRDEDGLRRLPSQIAIYRAAHAQGVGDVAGAMTHARRALDLVGDDDDFERGGAAGFLALAHWRNGELETAHRYWTAAMASLQNAGHVVDAIGCARAMAQIRIAQGRLRDAMSTYERGLQLATEHGAPVLRGAADMYVGMSELFLEWGELRTAMQHLLTSKELGEHAGLPQNRYRWRVAMARIRDAEGDADGALEMLHEAERLYVSEYYPDVRPIAALRARIWASQGRFGEALAWASQRGLSVEDDLSYLREFEHITLARLLLAGSKHDNRDHSQRDAVALLDRLLEAAEEGQRMRSVIEILVLQALAHQAAGDAPAGLVPLQRALALAEPEGYVRIFVDEGAPLTALLHAAARHGVAVNYVRRLLAASAPSDDATVLQPALVEPLSRRERDVLRLLATELDGPAIARELVVSLSTIRTHTKNIYAKLGVNSRRAAVRRADELNLLSQGSNR